MIYTRCPACTTTFRVTPEQLRAKSGRVRCGKCSAAFDALSALVELTPAGVAARAPAPSETGIESLAQLAPQPSGHEAEAAPHDAAAPGEIRVAPHDDAQSVDIPLDLVIEPAPETAGAGTAPTDRGLAEGEAGLAQAHEPEFTPPAVFKPPLGEEHPPAAAQAEHAELPEPPRAERAEPAEAVQPEPALQPAAARPAEEEPISLVEPARPSRRRWPAVLWGMLALLALLGLAGQAAYHYRTDLAARHPELRPMLEQACAMLRCEIPLPRQAELLSIESSDLAPVPGSSTALALSATIKNRATYALAYPHLEITLTDTGDRPLVRRVIAPAEYLRQPADTRAGFGAGAELGISLGLETGNVSASGYRVYVFYP